MKNIKTSFNQFFKTLKFSYSVDRKAFLIKAFSRLITVPFPLAQAYIAKLIMDQISLGIKTGQADSSLIFSYIGLEFGLIFFQSLIQFFQSRIDLIYRHKMSSYYENQILNKLEKIDFAYIENPATQNEIYEVRNRSYNIESMLDSFFNFIQGLSVLISFLGVLFTINPYISLLLFIITFFSFLNNHKYSKDSLNIYKLNRPLNRIKSHLSWMLVNPQEVKELKALNLEGHVLNDLSLKREEVFNQELKINKEKQIRDNILSNVSKLVYYGSYSWIIWLTLQNKISLGDLTMFMMLFSQTEGGLNNIFRSFVSINEENQKIKTFYDFFNLPEVHNQDLDGETFEKVKNNPIIEFKGVYFSYPSGKEILKNLNFKINYQDKIALVGENGAGKSTLLKLMIGLYNPTQGEILINGVNLNLLSRKQIKELMGIVFQDFVKLPYNFKENITLAQKDASIEEYESSLNFSGAEEVREKLKDKDKQFLHEYLFKGATNLSGGQWQKIILARAFIQKGKIIILDEPTSAIDAKQEYEIFKKFQDLSSGKTSILVSHRFSTVRIAQRILFLENGELIEDGSHAELLKLNGKYAHMFKLQAEGYK